MARSISTGASPPDPHGAPRIATLTLSDTRTEADDEGGRLLGELLSAAALVVVSHAIVREDDGAIREAVLERCRTAGIDAVVTTGGTGIAPRDRVIEVIEPLFEKTLDGFGEAFRRLSWDQVGARAVLSRAAAGVIEGRVVVALPGSVKAVRLAVEALVAPILEHAVDLASGRRLAHGARA